MDHKRLAELQEIAMKAHLLPNAEVGAAIREALIEVHTLRQAIESHRSKTGHDMCWENDEELWASLQDRIMIDHTAPPWCEFMTKCAEYRASKDKRKK